MNLQVLMAQLGFMSAENREYLRRMFSRAPEGFLEHLSLKKLNKEHCSSMRMLRWGRYFSC